MCSDSLDNYSSRMGDRWRPFALNLVVFLRACRSMRDLFLCRFSLVCFLFQKCSSDILKEEHRPHNHHDDEDHQRHQCKTTVDVYSDFNYRDETFDLVLSMVSLENNNKMTTAIFFFSTSPSLSFVSFSSCCYSSRDMKNRRFATIWLSK